MCDRQHDARETSSRSNSIPGLSRSSNGLSRTNEATSRWKPRYTATYEPSACMAVSVICGIWEPDAPPGAFEGCTSGGIATEVLSK